MEGVHRSYLLIRRYNPPGRFQFAQLANISTEVEPVQVEYIEVVPDTNGYTIKFAEH